jgi:hypothetical protein
MNKTMKLVACSLLLLPFLASAENWYQVEIIAFQYVEPEGEPELWASHPGEPEWHRGMFLFSSEAESRAHFGTEHVKEAEEEIAVVEEEPTHEPGFVSVGELVGANAKEQTPAKKAITEAPFVHLSSRNYTMQGVEKIINENPNYEILTHVAWRQPGLTGREVESVRIFGGNELGEGPDNHPLWKMEGLVTFKKSRFLHIDADVVLREPGSGSSGSFESAQELGLLNGSGNRVYRAPNLTTYRMQQSQRVRTDKLYYYDHPLMGMIVKVTPYEPA